MKNKNFFMVALKKIKNACSTLWGTPQRQVAFGGAYNIVAGYFCLAFNLTIKKNSFQKVFTTSQNDVVKRYDASKASRIASEGVAADEGCDDEFVYGSGIV